LRYEVLPLKLRGLSPRAIVMSIIHPQFFKVNMQPFVVSMSNHEHFTLRPAQGERISCASKTLPTSALFERERERERERESERARE
jgi:hypothetical protein